MREITIDEYAAVRAAAKRSTLEEKMALILRTMRQEWPEMPEHETEYRFAAPRRFKFDFAWPQADIKLAIECDGGTWMQTETGRSKGHGHPARIEQDAEKMNIAVLNGWRVLRFTSRMIDDALYVMLTVRTALEANR